MPVNNEKLTIDTNTCNDTTNITNVTVKFTQN